MWAKSLKKQSVECIFDNMSVELEKTGFLSSIF